MSEVAPYIEYDELDHDGNLEMQVLLTNILNMGAPGAFKKLIDAAKQGNADMITELYLFCQHKFNLIEKYILLISINGDVSKVKLHYVYDKAQLLFELNSLKCWQDDQIIEILEMGKDKLYHRTNFTMTLVHGTKIGVEIKRLHEDKKTRKRTTKKQLDENLDKTFEAMVDLIEKDT